ncbi:MAG: SPOR domain-containing protein [Clostridium sp.]|uniref:SPOR domain-containing protein n=1 Tax=Clostridium sp. TaxID=1506 RepID=UPI0025C5B8D3|nr:SPOR domain-containing protein [Clostridium sp.]MCE5222170.1 SPOR domain-containing protein [Clostridium sp.]
MRYTRYEYRKSNKIKFLCSVAVIALISIGGGLFISKFIFNGKQIQDNNSNNSRYSIEGNGKGKVPSLIALQCGYYSKEENAKELLTAISKYCEPFIVEEDGKYRVLAGIYKEEDGLKKIEQFKANNIDVAKVNLNISSDNIESKKIIEVIDGFLTITNKLEDNGVKSIKTTEFKEWTDKIITDDSIAKSKKINDLSSYVKNLPDEINKENSNINIPELYKLLKN